MKKIAKYANKKLYDFEFNRYTTLKEIKKLIYKDIPFTVMCHETGKDLTQHTVKLIICSLIMDLGHSTEELKDYVKNEIRMTEIRRKFGLDKKTDNPFVVGQSYTMEEIMQKTTGKVLVQGEDGSFEKVVRTS